MVRPPSRIKSKRKAPTQAAKTEPSGQAPDPAGTATRRAALRLLNAVLQQGQTLDVALMPATRELSLPEDRALALAIVSETLRRLPDLDALIDSATAQPLPLDAKARHVLRIALAQALVLKTPAHAAIATALPLVEGGPKRLVHGVFGTLMRREITLPEAPALPVAVAARWGHWGYGALANAARAVAEPPLLEITLKPDAKPIIVDALAAAGGEATETGFRFKRGIAPSSLPGFEEGEFWVQNASAALPVRLLGTGQGRSVLDLCAAPGGKTMQLAANGWAVTAIDRNERRLDRLRENLVRTQLSADVICTDILTWAPNEPVDAILLDAPCTATGTFARHPDVLHRIGPRDIASLAGVQLAMLRRAYDWLKPGGTLVYAVCSLEHEEGEGVIEASGLKLDPIDLSECPDFARPDAKGQLRILPSVGIDGFFIARLKRG